MNASALFDDGLLERLNGILRAGAGRLTPQEYFWYRLVALPGIRARSWDVAPTNSCPVLLEVNFGGDLNLAQRAHGAGVADETYAEHLRPNGDRL